ncbi:hypothetical protein HAX54_021192 [Datura stramonium]|uniref:Uncharacterized protein n=1 Tax=Datura stramonium TaxID=4076 RepID=A0ABS8UTW3_DATST|nr:hypothetical protein [Datura stramonium]
MKDSAHGNIGYKLQLINVLLSQVMPQSDHLQLNHLDILHVKDSMYGNMGIRYGYKDGGGGIVRDPLVHQETPLHFVEPSLAAHGQSASQLPLLMARIGGSLLVVNVFLNSAAQLETKWMGF